MSLTNHLIRLNLSESDLQSIIRMADNGITLSEIQSSNEHQLTHGQLYAILARYCREDGGGSIDLQYPSIHEEFIESRGDETKAERSRIVHKNKKVLEDTYEDLKLKEKESSDLS